MSDKDADFQKRFDTLKTNLRMNLHSFIHSDIEAEIDINFLDPYIFGFLYGSLWETVLIVYGNKWHPEDGNENYLLTMDDRYNNLVEEVFPKLKKAKEILLDEDNLMSISTFDGYSTGEDDGGEWVRNLFNSDKLTPAKKLRSHLESLYG